MTDRRLTVVPAEPVAAAVVSDRLVRVLVDGLRSIEQRRADGHEARAKLTVITGSEKGRRSA